jgi:hypothetical protein
MGSRDWKREIIQYHASKEYSALLWRTSLEVTARGADLPFSFVSRLRENCSFLFTRHDAQAVRDTRPRCRATTRYDHSVTSATPGQCSYNHNGQRLPGV